MGAVTVWNVKLLATVTNRYEIHYIVDFDNVSKKKSEYLNLDSQLLLFLYRTAYHFYYACRR